MIVLEFGCTSTHTFVLNNCHQTSFIVLFQKFRLSKHVTFLHFTNHSSWECIKTFKNIINNAVIFKMVKETLQIYSKRSWINLFYFVKHEIRQNTLQRKLIQIALQTLLTTKLEFRIDDISVEFGVHICQQLVLYI